MTPFRNWVHNLYVDNCEERQVYNVGKPLSKEDYFRKFKWWLRREYRHQQRKEKERDEIRRKFEQWIN